MPRSESRTLSESGQKSLRAGVKVGSEGKPCIKPKIKDSIQINEVKVAAEADKFIEEYMLNYEEHATSNYCAASEGEVELEPEDEDKLAEAEEEQP